MTNHHYEPTPEEIAERSAAIKQEQCFRMQERGLPRDTVVIMPSGIEGTVIIGSQTNLEGIRSAVIQDHLTGYLHEIPVKLLRVKEMAKTTNDVLKKPAPKIRKPSTINQLETGKGLCYCGCGLAVKNPKKRFVQGHDAKYHSLKNKLAATLISVSELKATVNAYSWSHYGVK